MKLSDRDIFDLTVFSAASVLPAVIKDVPRTHPKAAAKLAFQYADALMDEAVSRVEMANEEACEGEDECGENA